MIKLRLITTGNEEMLLNVNQLISVDDKPYSEAEEPVAATPEQLTVLSTALAHVIERLEALTTRVNDISSFLSEEQSSEERA